MRRTILSLALLALSACGSTSEEAPPPAAAPAPQPPPVSRAPEPVNDTCGAAAVQHLVGRPRSEIPVPVDPRRQRVACTTCPVTMDFSEERLNFFFDAQTGIIKEIRCG
jgi:hypothetical protein